MKTNLKSGNAIVRLLLAHGEKIGIVAILICAGMLLWSALGVPRLDQGRNPDALTSEANSAEQHVTSFTWDGIKEADPTAIIEKKEIDLATMKAIEPDQYPNLEPLNPHVIPPMGPRTDPVLLTAEDLEVHADSGLWASANPETIKQRQLAALAEAQAEAAEAEARESRDRDDEDERGDRGRGGRGGRGDGGRGDEEETRGPNSTIVLQPRTGVELQGFEDIRAQSWVTVLARIPIKAQNQLYQDVLMAARGYEPNRDKPIYLGYMIQRAEVTPSGQGEWQQLARVNGKELIKELATYPVNPQEVVDSRFVHPLLTHPLPPLILKEWDDRVSHSSMPLASEAVMMEEEIEEIEQPAAEGEEEDDSGFAVTTPQPGAMMGERGGYEMEMGGRGGYDMGGRGGYDMGGRGGGYAMEMDMGGRGGYDMGGRGYGGQMGAGSAVELASFEWDQKTESVLLRFFDNTVEPGRRYRYRVQLALMDVNNNIPPAMLDKTVSERRDQLKPNFRSFRLTEWSKPSPVASVPLPARLYLASADTANGKAEILIKALNSQYAAEIALIEDFARGAVMNLREKAAIVWSNQYEVERDPEFDFSTGATLVDVQGGEKLGKSNLTAPARVVLMDAAGKMMIQNELKDAAAVGDFKATLEAPRDGEGGFRGEFGGGRGGGGRGGRGGRGF